MGTATGIVGSAALVVGLTSPELIAAIGGAYVNVILVT
ncbi:hypothetical protein X743_30840 [Mesorhizobium sp. LNHC252B00]|nr:hypothetical protein X743_30840 [Mesorhizobium sp. LNHC252B00]